MDKKSLTLERHVSNIVPIKLEIEPGELILVHSNRENFQPVLGVFADFEWGKEANTETRYANLLFAERPVKLLPKVVLPGGEIIAPFIPYVTHTTIHSELWEYAFSHRHLGEIFSGKEEIADYLRSFGKGEYVPHAEVVQRMQKPYAVNPEVRKKLGIY
jgi:hypothetical protein